MDSLTAGMVLQCQVVGVAQEIADSPQWRHRGFWEGRQRLDLAAEVVAVGKMCVALDSAVSPEERAEIRKLIDARDEALRGYFVAVREAVRAHDEALRSASAGSDALEADNQAALDAIRERVTELEESARVSREVAAEMRALLS